jgi:hypothetical protein
MAAPHYFASAADNRKIANDNANELQLQKRAASLHLGREMTVTTSRSACSAHAGLIVISHRLPDKPGPSKQAWQASLGKQIAVTLSGGRQRQSPSRQ